MVTIEHLREVFNDEAEVLYQYLKNKNKGGTSNAKGNSFENFFAIYQMAKLFKENIDSDEAIFSSQKLCFIDDLVIEFRKDNGVSHFQIKDVQGLTWSKNGNSIATDFEMQYKVTNLIGIKPTLELVVSRQAVRDDLITNIPETIKELVKVTHFSTASSIPNLIRSNSAVKDELIKMCALSNPALNKLEALATILLGAWDATDKQNVSLKDLIESCYRQNPHYIKGFAAKISNDLAAIFAGVEGFTYKVENGFIRWKYNDTDEGTLSYPIGSREFEQLENDIFNASINTFDDLETLLN